MSFSFWFLSQLLRQPVVDAKTGARLGLIVDLTADVTKIYPNVTGFLIRRQWWEEPRVLPMRGLEFEENGRLRIQSSLPPAKLSLAKNEILLRETFLDKQIVDISGARVIRVNDLHLLLERSNLWVVHMDVGFSGLLRRLGWLKPYRPLVKWLFDYNLEDRFIQWKYVQPLADTDTAGALALKISYSKLSQVHPAELADILENLGTEERENVFKSLDTETAAKTLEKMPSKISLQLVKTLPDDMLAKILDELPADEAVDLLAEMPKKKAAAIYRLLPKKKSRALKELMKHARNSAGSLMNTELITVKSALTVGQTLEKIRIEHERAESVYNIYVVNEQNSLVGVLSLRQLVAAAPETPVTDIMTRKIIKVSVETPIDQIAQVFLKYDFHMLPVVDSRNRIKGIITVRDALEAFSPKIKEEMEN